MVAREGRGQGSRRQLKNENGYAKQKKGTRLPHKSSRGGVAGGEFGLVVNGGKCRPGRHHVTARGERVGRADRRPSGGRTAPPT